MESKVEKKLLASSLLASSFDFPSRRSLDSSAVELADGAVVVAAVLPRTTWQLASLVPTIVYQLKLA